MVPCVHASCVDVLIVAAGDHDVLLVGVAVVLPVAADSTVLSRSGVLRILVGLMMVFLQGERESRARAYIGPVVLWSVRVL